MGPRASRSFTNLLHRATCVERFALSVAEDADMSQLHFLLDVAKQSFGVHQVLHIRYEKPGSSKFEKRHRDESSVNLVRKRTTTKASQRSRVI